MQRRVTGGKTSAIAGRKPGRSRPGQGVRADADAVTQRTTLPQADICTGHLVQAKTRLFHTE